MVIERSQRAIVLAGGWLALTVIVLASSLLLAPRALAPLLKGMPQGTADLLSYYGAWWLLAGVGLGALARRRGIVVAYARGLAVAAGAMLPSLAIAGLILRPVLYPQGEYVNLGFQSVYLVLAALIVPNVTIGTFLLRRALRLPLGTSLALCVAWAVAFVAGLVSAEALVELVLVGGRRL